MTEGIEAYQNKINAYRGWVLRTMQRVWFGPPNDTNRRICGLKYHYSVNGKSLCGVSMFHHGEGLLEFVATPYHYYVHPLINSRIHKRPDIVCKKCVRALKRALREVHKRG